MRRFEFTRDRQAPSAARRAVSEVYADLDPETADAARLLVSELVTNSVQHGDGETVVVVAHSGLPDVIRCEVIDDGAGFVPGTRGDRPGGGWGLRLVEQLSSRWGVGDDTTRVWFDLPIGGSPRAACPAAAGPVAV
ncbi:MAG TPA: ATP-binding protein [Solirubrobacteraceae bacterium]|nr:ATP-binding protein [Solirubrobacteraceae bacterium]